MIDARQARVEMQDVLLGIAVSTSALSYYPIQLPWMHRDVDSQSSGEPSAASAKPSAHAATGRFS